MKQLIQDALAEGVSIKEIFETYVPRAHDMQKDMFSRVSEVPLIVSFWFEDNDERYTFEFSESGSQVEAGEMIDFPVVTIVLNHAQWGEVRPHLQGMLLKLQENKQKLEQRYVNDPIKARTLSAFESLHGTIHVHVEGIKLKVILNDYVEEGGASSFDVSVTHALLEQVINGDVSPREMANKIKVKGKMSFALELAGFFSTHFNM